MNANEGRTQTTLGVWLGLSGTNANNILVFDVEGTDSRERGEGMHLLYKMSSRRDLINIVTCRPRHL